jgi:DNA-binding NarL/FixJ family response regulator
MSDEKPGPIRVAIVEDRADVRFGLASLVGGAAGCACVGAYESAERAMDALRTSTADVLLMDIELPGMSGIDAAREVKKLWPSIQVMMLTVYEDDDRIFRSLQAGATGYVLKKTPPAELVRSIASVHEGGSPMSSGIARRVVETFHGHGERSPGTGEALTARENEILELLAGGFRYREIAERLSISLDTVRTHIRHIYEKLQVRSRTEATVRFLRGTA